MTKPMKRRSTYSNRYLAKRAQMMEGFFKLYGRLDKETVSLFGRFIAKCASMEDPNEYLKKVFRSELATTHVTIGASDGKGQEA